MDLQFPSSPREGRGKRSGAVIILLPSLCAVYVDRLHVRHLKLLRDFELDFTTADGEPRMWTVIIGRNGTAKTSILQAIALAAAGSRQVNGLAKPVVGHLVDRRARRPMEVETLFRFTPSAAAREQLHPLLGRAPHDDIRLHSSLLLQPKQSTLAGSSTPARGVRGGRSASSSLMSRSGRKRSSWSCLIRRIRST